MVVYTVCGIPTQCHIFYANNSSKLVNCNRELMWNGGRKKSKFCGVHFMLAEKCHTACLLANGVVLLRIGGYNLNVAVALIMRVKTKEEEKIPPCFKNFSPR